MELLLKSAFSKSSGNEFALCINPGTGKLIVTKLSATNSPATWHTSPRDIPNCWQAICKVVLPSATVKSRHCSGVRDTCKLRSRSPDKSVGFNTICGCINAVLIRFEFRGSTNRSGMLIGAAGEVNAPVFLTTSATCSSLNSIEFEVDVVEEVL